MLIKGFSGIAIIDLINPDEKFGMRFLSADFALTQGMNVYLSSEGGTKKRRIISPTTGDITGRISTILGEDTAESLYDLVYEAPDFNLQLYFYNTTSRNFKKCKVENLTFDCKAGELVQVSMDILATEEEQLYEPTESFYDSDAIKAFRISNEKLVQWTKTSINTSVFSGDIASFSYSIKNNLVTVKTAKSLLPRKLIQGVQEITGTIVFADVLKPPRNTTTEPNLIIEDDAIFNIENLRMDHRIAAHWSFRTPLNPEIVLSTLDWTRVDNMTS